VRQGAADDSESRLASNGSRLTVPVGAVVFDVLVESANENGPGFPWVTPISSDLSVLAPVHLCKRTGVSSLALTVTGFRARHVGTATLTALLSGGDQSGPDRNPRAPRSR
jgi:hypothetical protein